MHRNMITDLLKVVVILGIILFVATAGFGLNFGGTEQPQSIAQSPILQAISPTEVFIQSIEVIKNDIHIKVKIGGDYHHWNIDIKRLSESGSAGGIIVGKTFLSHILSDLKPGTYTICVGAADSENRLLGPQDCKGGIVIAPTEISIVSIDISGNDLMIDSYLFLRKLKAMDLFFEFELSRYKSFAEVFIRFRYADGSVLFFIFILFKDAKIFSILITCSSLPNMANYYSSPKALAPKSALLTIFLNPVNNSRPVPKVKLGWLSCSSRLASSSSLTCTFNIPFGASSVTKSPSRIFAIMPPSTASGAK